MPENVLEKIIEKKKIKIDNLKKEISTENLNDKRKICLFHLYSRRFKKFSKNYRNIDWCP